MLIVCPACASEYRIAADRVGMAGRSVRCAACRETWFLTSDEVAAGLKAEAGDENAGQDETPQEIFEALGLQGAMRGADEPGLDSEAEANPVVDEPLPRRKSRIGKLADKKRRFPAVSPLIAAGLVAFVLLPLALLGRSTVVRAMPQTASLFAAIGLPVNLRGVDLRDVVAFRLPAEGEKPAELVVEGDLIGVARTRVDVPPIEVEVRDAQDQPLYRWTLAPPRAALEPEERARFKASLSAPPEKGRHVEVRFVDPKPEAPKEEISAAEPKADPAPEAPAADPHAAPTESGH